MKKASALKRFLKSEQTVIILTTLLTLLWAVTAGIKLRDYKTFKNQMDLQPLLPFLKGTTKLILIPSELLAALLLVLEKTRRFGLKMSLWLLVIFSGYIIFLFITQPHLPCACGAPFKQLSWWQHLLFNCTFIALNIWALILYRKRKEVKMGP
ncbi:MULTISPECIES: MauE/DoxX family redox-associated membrane protein [Olivibacter]|uniref:MauE/DoxX family redox-associated membrane protein n=1 Tax=Olivibacter oleidegradans TaxID=760123 RepID=A0ABV6HLY5_9SPHI|nr:MauE/DoxX family redox-associated membrane protein [Olivibacter jilunii]MDX3914533.1 hypothetical protein [Pseudosphingobacterium sp.]